MDQLKFVEQNKSMIVTLQTLIDSGTLMPDQLEAALRARYLLRKLHNARSASRIMRLSVEIAKELTAAFVQQSSH